MYCTYMNCTNEWMENTTECETEVYLRPLWWKYIIGKAKIQEIMYVLEMIRENQNNNLNENNLCFETNNNDKINL